MARVNPNYGTLQAGYLFPQITRRTREFLDRNPGADIMRLGIGNTTEALTPAVIAALHEGVDRLASVKTYSGYGDEQGAQPLREAIAARYEQHGVHIDPDEQRRSFKARAKVPYKRHKLTDEDWRNRERWSDYELAVHDMVERTSTRTAPWTLVEGNDKRFARIRILESVCDRLEEALA